MGLARFYVEAKARGGPRSGREHWTTIGAGKPYATRRAAEAEIKRLRQRQPARMFRVLRWDLR